jgi:hypothetical protein
MLKNLFLVLIAITIASSCEPCMYANMNFSCGSIMYQLDVYPYSCCNGNWLRCSGPLVDPVCPFCELIDNEDEQEKTIHDEILGTNDIKYKYTSDGTIYSNYVRTAISSSSGYEMGPIVHSSELTVGSTVYWPIHGSDIGIFEVYHHNVTADHDNCCWSVEIGSSCEAKYCCGNGCCC